MDYEKAYKEALERARQFSEKPYLEDSKGIVDYIFPELKESEDEKMLNQLHSWMKEFGGAEEYTEKVYLWLKGLIEKQGEQKSAEISNVCEFSIETWIKIVDFVLTEHNGIGNYLDDPEVKDTAKKLQNKYKFDAASEEWDRVYRKGLDAGVNKGRAEALREQEE